VLYIPVFFNTCGCAPFFHGRVCKDETVENWCMIVHCTLEPLSARACMHVLSHCLMGYLYMCEHHRKKYNSHYTLFYRQGKHWYRISLRKTNVAVPYTVCASRNSINCRPGRRSRLYCTVYPGFPVGILWCSRMVFTIQV
jgi:hypothetical protein